MRFIRPQWRHNISGISMQHPSKRHNLDCSKDHQSRFAEASYSVTLKIRKMSTTVLSLYVPRHAN